MPWIKKHGTDPVTGKKLTSGDLIKLNFHKNSQGDYFDPVSYKVFNEHTAIVAILTSGNVFTKDTVDSLNIKPGFWQDLVDDTKFTRKDIIILQDPHNLENRDLSQFYYIKHDLKKDTANEEDGLSNINLAAMGNVSKILTSMQKGKEKEKEDNASSKEDNASTKEPIEGKTIDVKRQLAEASRSNIPYNAANFTTGKASASLTSTSADIATTADRALIDEEEWMFDRILPGEKAYVAMKTNFGTLNLELFCDKVGHFLVLKQVDIKELTNPLSGTENML
jgi:peptidyl-prolyl cis-trans isomerase-like protein 2